MPTHMWGDKDFDWHGLNDAINYITEKCTKAGIQVSSKEKWGNADIYIYLWSGQIFDLFYSQRWWRATKRWPSWLRTLDFKLGDFLNLIGFTKLVHQYQIYIYRKAYDEALTKWPHIKREIVGGMAEWELLEDVMVKHGLAQNFRDEACHAGLHLYNEKGYCSKCYVTPEILKQEEIEAKEYEERTKDIP